MIYIIEGGDCSGKDTFAEQLSKTTGYKIERGSSFEIAEKGADAMYEHMMNLLDKDNIIINRFMYSNAVYAKPFDFPLMSFKQFYNISHKMNEISAIVIYMNTDYRIATKRMKIRGDEDIKLEHIPMIYDRYETVMNEGFSYCPPPRKIVEIVTDSEKDGISSIDNQIKMLLKFSERIDKSKK